MLVKPGTQTIPAMTGKEYPEGASSVWVAEDRAASDHQPDASRKKLNEGELVDTSMRNP